MTSHRVLPVSQLTEFVRRDAELNELRTLVSVRRLVTITGETGVGKTRTAARLAEVMRRSFGEAMARVVVGDATGDRLTEIIAGAMQASEATVQALARSLGDRPFLLILDGVRDARAAAAVIEQILEHTTETRIVVTSCQRTAICGETPFVLAPLALPSIDALEAPATALASDTATLLVRRILDADPEFVATKEMLEDLLAVCRSTDGLPRLVEAAARAVAVLGVHEAALAVTENPTVLDSFLPRQCETAASFESVLSAATTGASAAALALMRRLSLLEGGCDLRFAADLFSDGRLAALAAPVAELVDGSLVRSETLDGERRLRVPLHYRVRLLENWPSAERTPEQQRMRNGMAARLRHCASVWFSDEQLSAIQFLNRHAADITALLSAMVGDPDTSREALEIISALRYYWQLHPVDPWPRARDWLGTALSMEGPQDIVTLRAMQTDAYIAYHEGDLDGALAQLKAIDTDLDAGIAGYSEQLFSVFVTALVDVADGRVEEAEPKLTAVLNAVLDAGLRDHVGEKYWHLAACQIVSNDEDAAFRTVTDGVAYCDRIGDVWGRAYMWCLLALVEYRRGEGTDALERVRAALEVMTRFGDRVGLGLCLQLFATIAGDSVDDDVFAAAFSHGVPTGPPVPLPEFRASGGWLSRPAALPAGRQLGEVLSQLTQGERRPSARPERPEVLHVLSARETEIAALIAEGLANPAIAARLVLSRRTVEGHVQRILAKLGFRSRSQIAVWVTQNAGADTAARS